MKHFRELTTEEISKFSDSMQADLQKFFEEARNKYSLCDLCLHNAVISMCESYVGQLMEAQSGTKH